MALIEYKVCTLGGLKKGDILIFSAPALGRYISNTTKLLRNLQSLLVPSQPGSLMHASDLHTATVTGFDDNGIPLITHLQGRVITQAITEYRAHLRPIHVFRANDEAYAEILAETTRKLGEEDDFTFAIPNLLQVIKSQGHASFQIVRQSDSPNDNSGLCVQFTNMAMQKAAYQLATQSGRNEADFLKKLIESFCPLDNRAVVSKTFAANLRKSESFGKLFICEDSSLNFKIILKEILKLFENKLDRINHPLLIQLIPAYHLIDTIETETYAAQYQDESLEYDEHSKSVIVSLIILQKLCQSYSKYNKNERETLHEILKVIKHKLGILPEMVLKVEHFAENAFSSLDSQSAINFTPAELKYIRERQCDNLKTMIDQQLAAGSSDRRKAVLENAKKIVEDLKSERDIQPNQIKELFDLFKKLHHYKTNKFFTTPEESRHFSDLIEVIQKIYNLLPASAIPAHIIDLELLLREERLFSDEDKAKLNETEITVTDVNNTSFSLGNCQPSLFSSRGRTEAITPEETKDLQEIAQTISRGPMPKAV